MSCEWSWLGRIGYTEARALQERIAGEVAIGEHPPTLLLLEHPHTYTLGRRAKSEHLLWDATQRAEKGVQAYEVDRGGDITYHGPGQLVGYPIIPLAPPGWQEECLPQADFIDYIRKLERLIIRSLADYGIIAGALAGKTGVWVSPDATGACASWDAQAQSVNKIASIGVKIDVYGVTRHGFALNIDPDDTYWRGIVPCGLENVNMVSMADYLANPPPLPNLAESLANHFGYIFDYKMTQNSTPAAN
ncbi:MAG: lipoyl(octanoyl) transferase LipB [Anaerolineae bacterium]|nr:lipoyl(octanoyl) transferase LipB [Anaerolineae bacterium]